MTNSQGKCRVWKWQIHIKDNLVPAKVEQELRGALIQRWLPYQDSWLRRAEQPERGSWKLTYNKGKHCRIINHLARLAYTPEKGLWRKLGKMWSDQNIPHLQSVPQLRGKTLGRVRQSHCHRGGVAGHLIAKSVMMVWLSWFFGMKADQL